ncbi:hypothetical protein BH23CHL5_BH23CHL5_22410 [soil metagenome]
MATVTIQRASPRNALSFSLAGESTIAKVSTGRRAGVPPGRHQCGEEKDSKAASKTHASIFSAGPGDRESRSNADIAKRSPAQQSAVADIETPFHNACILGMLTTVAQATASAPAEV